MFSNNLYYIDDYFMMISFLSKIKCNNIKTIELCLEINKDMLNKTIQFFKNDKTMIEMIKDIFKDLIIKNALSQNLKIFQLSIDIFNIIYINYRRYLKEQIELFFMKIFIGLLESEKKPFNYKDIIIDNLNFLLEKIGHNFFIEIYINYDCDSNFNAIFCVLINLFIKIRNGLFQQNKYTNTFKNINEINIIINKDYT
jgi:brefeldin A-inhibited guanine nucleotide-exchange protein